MNLFKFSQKYLFKYKKYLILYFITNTIAGIIAIFMPNMFGQYIDCLLKINTINVVYTFTVKLLTLSCISVISSYYLGILATKYQTKAATDLNFDLLEHIKKLPLSYLNSIDTTYINERINSDANIIISFVLNNFVNIFVKILIMFASLYFLFKITPQISIFLFSIIFIYIALYFTSKKIIFNVNFELLEKQNLFFARMNEQLYNIKFIKINSLFNELHNKLLNSFNELFKIAIKFSKITNAYSACDSTINQVATLIIFFVGGIEIVNHKLTIGKYTIINSYFSMLLGSISYFLSLGKNYQETKVSYTRTCEIINLCEENNGDIKINNVNEIEIKNLYFSYSKEQDIIKNFSYKFKKGNIYCLMGENGSGKSTLINIILGLYQDYSGQVLYNSQDIKNIDMYNARKLLIGVTEQEPVLMNDTIINNLILGLNENKISTLNEWCDKLDVYKFIKKSSNGLETNIYEKCTNLSGGEKQKLSQARAFIKDPDVIIFDEPTSAIDKGGINNIKDILVNLKKNKIIIITTHNYNFSSIADEVINLN